MDLPFEATDSMLKRYTENEFDEAFRIAVTRGQLRANGTLTAKATLRAQRDIIGNILFAKYGARRDRE